MDANSEAKDFGIVIMGDGDVGHATRHCHSASPGTSKTPPSPHYSPTEEERVHVSLRNEGSSCSLPAAPRGIASSELVWTPEPSAARLRLSASGGGREGEETRRRSIGFSLSGAGGGRVSPLPFSPDNAPVDPEGSEGTAGAPSRQTRFVLSNVGGKGGHSMISRLPDSATGSSLPSSPVAHNFPGKRPSSASPSHVGQTRFPARPGGRRLSEYGGGDGSDPLKSRCQSDCGGHSAPLSLHALSNHPGGVRWPRGLEVWGSSNMPSMMTRFAAASTPGQPHGLDSAPLPRTSASPLLVAPSAASIHGSRRSFAIDHGSRSIGRASVSISGSSRCGGGGGRVSLPRSSASQAWRSIQDVLGDAHGCDANSAGVGPFIVSYSG